MPPLSRGPGKSVGTARNRIGHSEVVSFNLSSKSRRTAFLAVCFLILAPYLFASANMLLTAWLAQQPDLESLRRAARLEPGNADLHHQIGRRLLYAGDAAAAIEPLEYAVRLNPGSSRIWLDLGTAYQVTADTQRQSVALERALEADPTTPDVSWEAANFYLVRGDSWRALELLKTVARSDDRYREVASLAWRATHDADQVLAVLPRKIESRLQFLEILVSQQQAAAADHVWSQIVQLHEQTRPGRLMPYITSLLVAGRVEEAMRAWEEAAQIAPALHQYQRSENLVVNAGFEQNLLDGGFDWITNKSAHAQVSVDFSTFRSGQRSLGVVFDGGAPELIPVTQLMPVQAGSEYELVGYIKTDSLLTASALRLSVVAPGFHAAAPPIAMGTTPWREYRVRFRVPSGIRLVSLLLLRDSPNMRIEGSLWLDDLLLVKR